MTFEKKLTKGPEQPGQTDCSKQNALEINATFVKEDPMEHCCDVACI